MRKTGCSLRSNSSFFVVGAVVAVVLTSAPSCRSFQLQPPCRHGPSFGRSGITFRASSDQAVDNDGRVAFVVDRIERGTERLMRSVSDMCIDVFFNDAGNATPWKGLQLAYLRHMQYSDLRFRFLGATSKAGAMFVAREVLPVGPETFVLDENDLIADEGSIKNSDLLDGEVKDWVRGDVLGFVEITEKRFGLGEQIDGTDENTAEVEKKKVKLGKKSGLGSDGSTVRPFLSNLSVREDARRSGVGSALVDLCEEAVLSWPDKEYTEIVLQVEEDNPSAQMFYEKRGYEALFADPACRRFDTTGFLLKQVPTTKVAMRKDLKKSKVNNRSKRGKTDGAPRFNPSDLFGRLRDAMLVPN